MTVYVCEFCRAEFVKASNLSKHHRSAKYCIEIQRVRLERDSQMTCEYCKKLLSRSDSLHRHYISCIEYLIYQRVQVYETEISSLKERLAEKDEQLQEIKEKLWELTSDKTTNYTHIKQIIINEATTKSKRDDNISTAYPLTPPAQNQDQVTELVDKVHHKVVNVFSTIPENRHKNLLTFKDCLGKF